MSEALFPELISSIQHYNDIPAYAIGKCILDVGSSDGKGAYFSKYGKRFQESDYLGVDVQQFSKLYFPVVTTDLFDFESFQRFDTILFLHVLEHLPLSTWKQVLEKYTRMLRPGGYLVVNVPYLLANVSGYTGAMQHIVNDIDENLFLSIWDFDTIKYGKSQLHFRSLNESLTRAVLRAIKRIVTRHPYSILKRERATIIGIWRKKE